MGSYIGGIISGITTLLGIYIGIQYEKNKQRNHRAIENRQILHKAHDWCFSVKVILEDIAQKDLTSEIIDTDEKLTSSSSTGGPAIITEQIKLSLGNEYKIPAGCSLRQTRYLYRSPRNCLELFKEYA